MSRVRLPARLSVSLAFEDDQALLARFTEQRDEQAFAAIVARHSRMVYGVCKRLLRDEHLAEDAFQAVLLVLAKHPERIATASSVGGWLFGIARRVSLAARRHEERRFRREHAHQQPDGCRSPAAGFDDLLQVLDEELGRLPEAERAALIAWTLPKPLVLERSPIPYRCTIHPWMAGYVRIFDHPYFALTDADSNFTIPNAPAGQFRIVFWHESVGVRGGIEGRFGEPIAVAGPTMEMKPTDFEVGSK